MSATSFVVTPTLYRNHFPQVALTRTLTLTPPLSLTLILSLTLAITPTLYRNHFPQEHKSQSSLTLTLTQP